MQEHYSDADGANYKFVIVGDSSRRRRKVGISKSASLADMGWVGKHVISLLL